MVGSESGHGLRLQLVCGEIVICLGKHGFVTELWDRLAQQGGVGLAMAAMASSSDPGRCDFLDAQLFDRTEHEHGSKGVGQRVDADFQAPTHFGAHPPGRELHLLKFELARVLW